MKTDTQSPQRDIYSVTRLNREVRAVLDGSFPLLWIEGEISNLARPSSGHLYFSLKDPQSQVRCALFRTQRLRLRMQPANGMQVLARVRVGLYEPRGDFQLTVEHMETAGEGALRLAFEQRKAKLAAEGLFDSAHKRGLPVFPRQIGIITSSSGAALRDVLSVLRRRFPAIPVIIYPTLVQGEEAPGSIAAALRTACRRAECDVLLLCRGGGSLEDLMAFNDESVAHSIFDCELPIVTGVGHEIDFTIADFVADQRAPTPSAAAELVTPDRSDWFRRNEQLRMRLLSVARRKLMDSTLGLRHLTARVRSLHPGVRLPQQQQRLDGLELRLRRVMQAELQQARSRVANAAARLGSTNPRHRVHALQRLLVQLEGRLWSTLRSELQRSRQRFAKAVHLLDNVSPLATLRRGYSITRRLADREILFDSRSVAPGDRVETRLSSGSLIAEVLACRPAAEASRPEPEEQPNQTGSHLRGS